MNIATMLGFIFETVFEMIKIWKAYRLKRIWPLRAKEAKNVDL